MREEVIQQLVATGKWSENDARIGERANFHCEYCDLDMLGSAENYKLWQIDHIIPPACGGTNDLDNLAVACKTCNWSWKNRWDPRTSEPEHTREKLIQAVRRHVLDQRALAEAELESFRKIVG